jgi:hypothetical protein
MSAQASLIVRKWDPAMLDPYEENAGNVADAI